MNHFVKSTVIIATIVTLFSCASADKIILPSGEEGIIIRCEEFLSRCYKQASKSCPDGYEIKETITSSNFLVPVYDLIVACK